MVLVTETGNAMPRLISLAAALILSTAAASAQNTLADLRAQISDPAVGIMGAGINGEMTKILWDISTVTSEDGVIRVLPILGGGGNLNRNRL